MKLNFLAALAVMTLGAIAAPSQAATVTLSSIGTGWINQLGGENGSTPANNYIVGNCGAGDCGIGEFRDFFTFNVAPGHYSAANLRVSTFTVSEIQSSGVTVQFTSTTSHTFGGLGTGIVYATKTYTGADNGLVESISLNGAALAALNLGGSFQLSGRVISPTIFSGSAPDQFAYGRSYSSPQLDLTPGVPEPAAWALMVTGFGLVGFAARRRSGVVAA